MLAYRPSPEEDPHNLFIRKCHVQGASDGKLAGKRFGLKDNIMVAGVPMTNGSRFLEGFVPQVDSTVAERILDAGAVIVGKLNQDDWSMGGTSQTSSFGSVRNPINPEFSPGGSSSAAGAAVVTGDVDIALGVDQRGSGRIPASWTGTVAMKATHGLVPTFGLAYMDHTLDFICPIAKTVEDAALTLEVIAGEDPRDAQWVRGPIKVGPYTQTMMGGVGDIRVGVLKEAFEWGHADPDIISLVRDVIGRLPDSGIAVEEVSAPLFTEADTIWQGIVHQSMAAMVESDQEGYWRGGMCNVAWQAAFGKFRRARADDFQPFTKIRLVLGKYLQREYMSTYFSKAQNLRVVLREQIDEALRHVDILVMPTTVQKPTRLLDSVDTKTLVMGNTVGRGSTGTANTSAFDLTGHPCLTIPCGTADGFPVGLQLVGRHWEESLLFRLGRHLQEK